MKEANEIPASEAIHRMRVDTKDNKPFELHHYTYDHTTDATSGLRIVSKCLLRKSLPKETFRYDSDLYLTYHDVTEDLPRMCFKRLIRFVSFANEEDKLLKINWFV